MLLIGGSASARAEEASRLMPDSGDHIRDSVDAITTQAPTATSFADAERFDPLRPVDTAGPRETLTDLLRRVDDIQSIFRLTIASYLESDRLFVSQQERQAMARAMVMAKTAGGLLEFEGLPVAIESPEFQVRVLLTLRDLLARIELPPLDRIPDGAAMAAASKTSWRVPGTGIEIRRIAEGPRAGEWLFSAGTIQRLREWHEDARDLPYRDERVRGFRDLYVYAPLGLQWVIPPRWTLEMPPLLDARLLEEPVWRWLGLLAGIAIAWALLTILRRWLAWKDARTREATTADRWRRLLVPVAFGLLAFALRWFSAHNLRFGSTVYGVLMIGFTVLIYVSIIRILWLAASALAESVIVSRRVNTQSIDGQLVRLSLRSVAVVLSLGVLIEGANRIGLPAYSIITGLGVGGIAVALAARESLANLMGSFIVMIEKPFRVGQSIRVAGVEGIVEDIGFRSTLIRTPYDSLVSVPSSKILEAPIDNLGRRSARQFKTTLGIAYGTRRDVLARFVDGVREIVATHPRTRKDGIEVAFNDFADSGLVVGLNFMLEVQDHAAEMRCREEILLSVLEYAERLGVEFASAKQLMPLEPSPTID
jgi:MscS family membrane protein